MSQKALNADSEPTILSVPRGLVHFSILAVAVHLFAWLKTHVQTFPASWRWYQGNSHESMSLSFDL